MRRLPLVLALALPFAACVEQPNNTPDAGEVEQPTGEEPDAGPPPCTYPESNGLYGVGSIMPHVVWETAYMPEGATLKFDLEDVYCQRTPWQGIETVFFIIVAEWCPNCPDYLRRLDAQARQISEAGGLVVIADLQTRNPPNMPTNESAHAYASNYTNAGLRVGELDANPPGTIHDSGIWSAVPGTFVVRTRDMQVIANQEDTPYYLPWVQIARHPEADWSDPANPPFLANCGPDDEEIYEPNDDVASAAPIEPGTFEGGICADGPDYYQIDIAGDWSLDVVFSHAEGDLDVYVVDPTTGEPLMNGPDPVGSYSAEDNESFQHSGPATVRVEGFNKASATYTLTLTEL